MWLLRFAAILALFSSQSLAFAGSGGYDSTNMWGTVPSGTAGDGAKESAAMHVQNAIIAGQVNSAKKKLLHSNGSGDSYNIYSIGSQSVISNNVVGSHNVVDVDATQRSYNGGNVSSNGEISVSKNAKQDKDK